MRLLNLDSRVQAYLVDGVISEGHGRTLLSVEDPEEQYKIAQKIIDYSMSVREVEDFIKKNKKTDKNKRTENSNDNPYYNDIRNKLEIFFGTKVFLNKKRKKGKIEIEYYSEEDLQRILDVLKV